MRSFFVYYKYITNMCIILIKMTYYDTTKIGILYKLRNRKVTYGKQKRNN